MLTAEQERGCGGLDKESAGPGISQVLGGGTPGEIFPGGPPLSGASRAYGADRHKAAAPPQNPAEGEGSGRLCRPRGKLQSQKGETSITEGGKLTKSSQAPPPRPAPHGPTATTAMRRRHPVILRVGEVVGLGSSAPGAAKAPGRTPLAIVLQGKPPGSETPRIRDEDATCHGAVAVPKSSSVNSQNRVYLVVGALGGGLDGGEQDDDYIGSRYYRSEY